MTLFEKGWTIAELEYRYYEWLVSLVYEKWFNYTILLRNLYDTPFRVTMLMDENRVDDGLGLRARFIWNNDLGTEEWEMLKFQRPCSVLEVMIGLAQRFEEEYMTQYDGNDRTSMWFGTMIDSLGLMGYNDQNFDIYGFDRAMKKLLDREYSPNGRGSFFYIPNTHDDMRQIEIWQQMMMWYQGGNTDGQRQNAEEL